MHQHAVLDRRRATSAIHLRGDALRLREVGEPEREVQQEQAVLEEDTASRLRAPGAPPLRGAARMVRAGPDADYPPQLSTVEEAVERLHVAPKPVVVGHDDFPIGTGR